MRPMFDTLTWLLLGISSAIAGSDTTIGKLTLDGGSILFKSTNQELRYSYNHLPGIHTINYQKKSLHRSGKDIDISELTLEMSDGIQLTLIEGAPITTSQTRFTKDNKEFIIWKPVPK